MEYQASLYPDQKNKIQPFRSQLLKWVGNKQKFASEIISYFPPQYNKYIEPFLGSGGVLASLAPTNAIASDNFPPIIEIFSTLKSNPETLKEWYEIRYKLISEIGKKAAYEKIKAAFNNQHNGADFLFLSRSCYGGVIRFRKADGYMSTPVGVHDPISPQTFNKRVDLWHTRVQGTRFILADFKKIMEKAEPGDMIYCDPPYSDSQGILYGAQDFDLLELFHQIKLCKDRGIFIALSIDGTKKSGTNNIDLPIPDGLFENELFIEVGKSMLRRFQLQGETLENESVSDRLLLTY